MTRVVRILTRWLAILAGFVPSGVRSVWATIPAQLAVYILRRLVGILVAAAAIIAVGYVLMFYAPGPGPGAPAVLGAALGALAARHPRIYDGVMAMFQARYGYAHPLYNQVAQYVWHSLTFKGRPMSIPASPSCRRCRTLFPSPASWRWAPWSSGSWSGYRSASWG